MGFFFSYEEWDKKGQMMREEDDCSLAAVLACPWIFTSSLERPCTRTFKRGCEYRFHVKNCSENKCDKCGKVFTNSIQLKKHVKHTESIRCDVCLKHFSGQQALKRHKTSLHDNVKFECSIFRHRGTS